MKVYRNQAWREATVLYNFPAFMLVYYIMPNGVLYVNKILNDAAQPHPGEKVTAAQEDIKYTTISPAKLKEMAFKDPLVMTAVTTMYQEHIDELYSRLEAGGWYERKIWCTTKEDRMKRNIKLSKMYMNALEETFDL